MPWREKKPLASEQIARTWKELLEREAGPGKRLVYIHVPFCANHCLFCGFYKNQYKTERSEPYADLVIRELRAEASTPAVGSQPIHAVYLGGGTPSALETPDLTRIIEEVHALPLAADCEITLEGRMSHFTEEKIDACIDAGVNRFSLGIQTFDTEVRRKQGRRSSKEETLRFVDGLLQRDRAAVVIDLMFGLPGQTAEIWEDDLRTCLELQPDGVDLYCLNVFPGTPLFQQVKTGKTKTPSALPQQGEMYRRGFDVLADAGWNQLSNSHWAKGTRERNLYNLLIKEGSTTLAFGSGAGGSIGAHSYTNSDDLDVYCSSIEAGEKALSGMRVADAHQPLRDLLAGSLDRGRLDLACLASRFEEGPALLELYAPLLAQWEDAGLAAVSGQVVTLTPAGRFWSTNLSGALGELLQIVAEEVPHPAAMDRVPLPTLSTERMR